MFAKLTFQTLSAVSFFTRRSPLAFASVPWLSRVLAEPAGLDFRCSSAHLPVRFPSVFTVSGEGSLVLVRVARGLVAVDDSKETGTAPGGGTFRDILRSFGPDQRKSGRVC